MLLDHVKKEGKEQEEEERSEYQEINDQGYLIETTTASAEYFMSEKHYTTVMSNTVSTTNTSKNESEENPRGKVIIPSKMNSNTESMTSSQTNAPKATEQNAEDPTYPVYPDIPSMRTYTVTPEHNTGQLRTA